MAITTPDAVPGELITAAWGDAVRADLTTLDDATNVIRRRMTRTNTAYAVGVQQIFFDTSVEDVGGITGPAAGLFTVPASSTYAVTLRGNANVTPGAASMMQLVSGSGATQRHSYPPTTVDATVTGMIRLAAAETLRLDFVNGTAGSVTLNFAVEIVSVSRQM